MNEIGSEFHQIATGNGTGVYLPPDVVDDTFSFCGRTAIETVLKNESEIRKALLPSYCCESMIQPFVRAGIDVAFYGVNYNKELRIDLQIEDDVDCIVWCNYFGFTVDMPDLSDFIERGGIVIEDITHSFFSRKQYHCQSHYLVASLRKWEPILCGGYCASFKSELHHKPAIAPPIAFLNQKRNAMQSKTVYLEGAGFVPKEVFLKAFSDSNTWLSQNYSELAIDEESVAFLKTVNLAREREVRRGNAQILYEGLEGSNYRFLFKQEDVDCPLFFPIVIGNSERNSIRKRLIDHHIYCPVHWPKPDGCESNLYDTELSLICDQRYDKNDMKRVVSVLCD